MFMGLMHLGKNKCIQLRHFQLSVVPLRLELLEKLRSCKSQGIDQIPAELLQAGYNTLCFEIHRCLNSI